MVCNLHLLLLHRHHLLKYVLPHQYLLSW
uniref:Uncharacterized protein n=1 Tax=Lepeophtheirus salmonis TaxID=72036 RepID=A0A0K2SX07_LEPSM